MSVLEAFVHDPLVEWTSRVSKLLAESGSYYQGRGKSDPRDIRSNADKNLHPIKRKLRGVMNEGTVVSVPNQVETLIKEATSPRNLVCQFMPFSIRLFSLQRFTTATLADCCTECNVCWVGPMVVK